MSGITKGPWIFGVKEYDDDLNEVVIEKTLDYSGLGYYANPCVMNANGDKVVGCDEYHVFSGEADIRLICAAPDLLEALENLENDNGQIPSVAWDLVCSAIAKARGHITLPATQSAIDAASQGEEEK